MGDSIRAHCRIAAATACGIIGSYSAASRAAPNQSDVLAEVVVTAEKREGTASRIGMSILALDEEALLRAGVTDTRDLVQLVPGFTAAQSITNTPIYTLRGIGFNTPNLSSTSPVGVYVNDTAYAYPFMTQQTAYDLERVEVLKGPQGTLYGRNTTGGLIKFVTAAPTDSVEASVKAGYGNYRTFVSSGFLSGPLTETLGGRIAYSMEKSEQGWQRSVTHGERLGEKDRLATRGTLSWQPVDDLTATWRASFWRDRSDTQAPQAIAYIPETPVTALPDTAVLPSIISDPSNSQADWTPRSHPGAMSFSSSRPAYGMDSEFFSTSLDLEYGFGPDLILNSSTAYSHVDRHDMTDVNGIPFETLSYEPRGRINSISQELRLSRASSGMSWTLGGYYSLDRILEGQVAWLNDFSTVQLIRLLGGTIPNGYAPGRIAEGLRLDDAVSNIRSESASVFFNLQPQLSDSVKLTLGARYNEDRTSFRGCLRDVQNNAAPIWNVVIAGAIAGIESNIPPGGCLTFNPTLTALTGEVSDQLDESNVSWRFGADWTPSEYALVYGTVSRGFKSGGFPIVPANLSSQYRPFRQEKVTAFEVGTKLRLLDGTLRTSVAAFYNDYRDKQVFTVVPDPIFRTLERTQNVPESKITGVEGEVEWRVTSSLTARAAAAYTQTEVIEYQGFDQSGTAQDFKGDEFPYSPRWQASAGLDHEVPLPGRRLALRTSVNVHYQSRSHGDFADTDLYRIDPYALVDAVISVLDDSERWEVSLWSNNLLDKDYWTTVTYGRDVYVRYSGMPRTYGLSVTWKLR